MLQILNTTDALVLLIFKCISLDRYCKGIVGWTLFRARLLPDIFMQRAHYSYNT